MWRTMSGCIVTPPHGTTNDFIKNGDSEDSHGGTQGGGIERLVLRE
jgi:hypothetical protein